MTDQDDIPRLDVDLTPAMIAEFGRAWEEMRKWRNSSTAPGIEGEKRRAALLALTRMPAFRVAMAELLVAEGYVLKPPATAEECDELLDRIGGLRRVVSIQTGEDLGIWAGSEFKRLSHGMTAFQVNQALDYLKGLRGEQEVRTSRVMTAPTFQDAVHAATERGKAVHERNS